MDDRRKNYRVWDAQQCSQQAISPQDALPKDDLIFFLLDTIPLLDLAKFHRHYAAETRGQPPFDVTLIGDPAGIRSGNGQSLGTSPK